MSTTHKYIRKEYKNGKAKYIYNENSKQRDKNSKEIAQTVARGSNLAGHKYRELSEFFNRRRSKKAGVSAGSKDQRREEERIDTIAFCKSKGLWSQIRLPNFYYCRWVSYELWVMSDE